MSWKQVREYAVAYQLEGQIHTVGSVSRDRAQVELHLTDLRAAYETEYFLVSREIPQPPKWVRHV